MLRARQVAEHGATRLLWWSGWLGVVIGVVGGCTALGASGAAEAAANAACSAIRDAIPMVHVRSGQAELAAAWRVSRADAAGYLETQARDEGVIFESGLREAPEGVVDVCIFEGDFETFTPGPPGHDRSAARVLVVMADGHAQLWSIAKTKEALPLEEPGA